MTEILEGALTRAEMERHKMGLNPFKSPQEFLAGTFALRKQLASSEEGAMAIAGAAIDAFTTTADTNGTNGGKVCLGDAVKALESRRAKNHADFIAGAKEMVGLSKGEEAFLTHRDILCRMIGGQGMRAITSEVVRGHVMQMLKHMPGVTYQTAPIQHDALALMEAIGQQLGGPTLSR